MFPAFLFELVIVMLIVGLILLLARKLFTPDIVQIINLVVVVIVVLWLIWILAGFAGFIAPPFRPVVR